MVDARGPFESPQLSPWPSGDITVADLLAVRHLALELIAGDKGLARRVSWTHVCELVDPGPWLDGGELLIANGFRIPTAPSDQIDYLDRLMHYRVSAIALGCHTPTLSPEMLEHADAEAFPVIRIPRQVPFISLSHMVAGANASSTHHRLLRDLQLFDALRLRDGRRATVPELMGELEAISGYRLALITPARQPLLSAWPWVPEMLWPAPGTLSSEDVATVDGGYAIPISIGGRVEAHLVGILDDARRAAGLSHLRRIAVIVALEVAAERERREERRRAGQETLVDLLSGRISSHELERRLSAHRLAPGEGLCVAVLRASTGQPVNVDRVHYWFADRQRPYLLTDDGRLVTVLCQASTALEHLVAQSDLRAGIAQVDDGLNFARARQRALVASIPAARLKVSTVIHADDDDRALSWSPGDPDALIHLVKDTLAPLLDHYAEHGSDLVITLRTYLEHNRRSTGAARELGIRAHTVANRLRKVEELTGRDLADFYDAFELWLALEADPMTEGI